MLILLLNMSAILTESDLLTNSQATYVTLGILNAYVLIIVILDVLVAGRMLSSLFAPYLVVDFAFTMIYYKQVQMEVPNENTKAVTLVSLTVAGILTLVKLIVGSLRALGYGCIDDSTAGKWRDQDQKIDYGAVAYEHNSGPSSLKDPDEEADEARSDVAFVY